MSVLGRVRDWLDAPRFCRDCGQPIRVRNIEGFDERTGESHDRWYWMCPEVYVSVGGGRITWTQTGNHIHAHGQGRPRWHLASTSTEGERPA